MDSFFIDAAKLPGGAAWAAACGGAEALLLNRTRRAADIARAEQLRATLRCDNSVLGGFAQVVMLLLVYGAVLYCASSLIADGSELLLLVKSLRDIVGSVVLPILGAVPDAAIVLFSALGENAQEEVAVGVGALAGSTIMLLTVPWSLAIIAGRVNLVSGVPNYKDKHNVPPINASSLGTTGVQAKHIVVTMGRFMMITAASYVVIQMIAFTTGNFIVESTTAASTLLAAKKEHNWALFCFVVCTIFSIWYLYTQISSSPEQDEYRTTVVDQRRKTAIAQHELSLTAAFKEMWEMQHNYDETTPLTSKDRDSLNCILAKFFNAYDRNDDGSISVDELQPLMHDLGEDLTKSELRRLHARLDQNNSDSVTLDEFQAYMPEFIRERAKETMVENGYLPQLGRIEQNAQQDDEVPLYNHENEEQEDDEDEEVVPDDLRHENPHKQLQRILIRSFTMMTAGTLLVLSFSDPMVGVMNEVGKRVGVPAFYISFALAPLASNASEILAAYSYAAKKTHKTITISFSTLLGAAILNNTFVLAVFMLLIAVKGLAWQFTAETISILFVEAAMGYMALKRVHKLRDAFIVLSLYPISLFIVVFLEKVVGLD